MNIPKSGLTLLELCVVIFIVIILIALLLPVMNSARITTRNDVCRNNIRQITMACLSYESGNRTLPPGGWANGWAGDPTLGDGKTQPGGWMYAILPHLGLGRLHLYDMDGADKAELILKMQQTPVRIFHCPSRRIAEPLPTRHTFYNSGSPGVMGKTDYAGNGGDGKTLEAFGSGPGMDTFTEEDWRKEPFIGDDTNPENPLVSNGVFQRRSGVRLAEITDGPAHTYLLGDKYLYPEAYLTGEAIGDDHGWNVGFDDDIIRFTRHVRPALITPARDTPNLTAPVFAFGSAHASGFNMSMADGSARSVSFRINPEVHANLGIRNSGMKYGEKEF